MWTAPDASEPSGGVPPPQTPLRAPGFRFRFSIYMPPTDRAKVKRAVATAVEAAGFKLIAERESSLPATTVQLVQPPIELARPPAIDEMERFGTGLDSNERVQLSTSKSVACLEVVGPAERAFGDYRKALLLGRDLAKALHGLPWDDEMRSAFTQSAWNRRIDAWQGDAEPNVIDHVLLDQYREGELFRIVSLGMVKFGLPDVVVNQVAGTDAAGMAALLNLTLQGLLEQKQPDSRGRLALAIDAVRELRARSWLLSNVGPNGKRSVELQLTEAVAQKDDAKNRLLEIAFAGPPKQLQQRHNQLLSALFGSKDATVSVEHDADIQAASKRAKAKVLAMRARYAKSPPAGEQLLVKAPFTSDTATEWMWVEVVRWQGSLITGILDNDPQMVPRLKAGAHVEIHEDDILDYILTKRDGTREGNETGELLKARSARPQTRSP